MCVESRGKWKEINDEHEIAFSGDTNILKQIGVKVAHLCECAKVTELYTI